MHTTPQTLSTWLARIAVAFCFLSFGIWELVDPPFWTGYVPAFMTSIVSAKMLVLGHGVALIVVGLGVISGMWPNIWTALATLIMIEITVSIGFEEGFSTIFIRDAALLLFTAAMFAQSLVAL